MPWITSHYPSKCYECGEEIAEDERIVYEDRHTYCRDCGEEVSGVDPATNGFNNRGTHR